MRKTKLSLKKLPDEVVVNVLVREESMHKLNKLPDTVHHGYGMRFRFNKTPDPDENTKKVHP